jgi:hypothetical protein
MNLVSAVALMPPAFGYFCTALTNNDEIVLGGSWVHGSALLATSCEATRAHADHCAVFALRSEAAAKETLS